MHANITSIRLKHIALLVPFLVSTAWGVSAQPRGGTEPTLGAALRPGMTVWITDSAGREEKGRIVGVTGDTVTTTADGDLRRVRTADVTQVKARRSDSLINGALIGAGAAVASGLFVCRAMEPWDVCLGRDNAGPMIAIGAVGAGIGIGIDALIRGRKTIYDVSRPSTRLYAAPIVDRRAAGLQLSVSF